MADKKTVHVISHTHWDREWYLPYEKHHVRLIPLMDTLLDLLESDPEFRSFHLDSGSRVKFRQKNGCVNWLSFHTDEVKVNLIGDDRHLTFDEAPNTPNE